MNLPILSTKLHIPQARFRMVQRKHLFKRLHEGLQRKLTLVSASAGYGKTTLISEWLADCRRPAAWVSLDESDNEPVRFLQYLMASMNKIINVDEPNIEKGLQYQQPLPIKYILTALVHKISTLSDPFILVLDDYHVIESQTVHDAVAFLLDNQPAQMHIALVTREDPPLPIARLRAKHEVTELRGSDLRFSREETSIFFNRIMGLNLSCEEVFSLEKRTEGWIAGLHLAAISMQGCTNHASFIASFTGSHRVVLDYLMEEVLMQQSAKVQTFLLQTSILDRFCGSLCDAVMQRDKEGHEILAYLERCNLFVIPLDHERRWYRYHHLFADLLRQRLYYAFKGNDTEITALHHRASRWFEDNKLEIEAFRHAAAAQETDRAIALIEGKGMPLHFRGGEREVLKWLEEQDKSTLDERPSLWVIYASALLIIGQSNGIEEKLTAAEVALERIESQKPDGDLAGHIASIRATLAVARNEPDTVIAQSLIALNHLPVHNIPVRAAAHWTLGVAYQLKGDRTAAKRAYTEALWMSKPIGHLIITLMATLGLGQLQESDNQLKSAMETYKQAIELAGEPPLPAACDAHLGMARIYYEWNDLDAAEVHSQQSIMLAREIEHTDRLLECELCAVKLKLARQDLSVSEDMLIKVRHELQERSYFHLVGEAARLEMVLALYRGEFFNEAMLLKTSEFPILQARIHILQGNAEAALTILGKLYERAAAKQWKNELLKVLVLQALAFQVQGNTDRAMRKFDEAITLTGHEDFVRLFVDEGKPMLALLTEADTCGIHPDDTKMLLSHMSKERELLDNPSIHCKPVRVESLVDPLSERELEVLRLIAQGLSNQEIGDRLFLALSTVKGYNRNIFDKLQVRRRTEAIARAREIGLI